MSLLQLPDALLLAVLEFCADDPTSLARAARAHSRLHQAAALVLTSIRAVLCDQGQLDSLLLYLERHGQHVNSIHLTGNYKLNVDVDDDRLVTLCRLPGKLHLRSLQCNDLRLMLDPRGHGLLGLGAHLKQLRLSSCLLPVDGDGYGENELAEALAELPALEHLCIDGCDAIIDGDSALFHCPTDIFESLQQLTYLELVDIVLHPWILGLDELPAQPNLQALTRLVDLRLRPYPGLHDSVSADMMAGVCHLTRLELSGFESFDARVLAGKTLLQHLALPEVGADVAELLSQLQHLQQLTHLDLRSHAMRRSWGDFEEGNPPAAAFSALTASSQLQSLDISGCTVPADAWQHMFPTGRQLRRLRSLDISCVVLASMGGYAAPPEGSRLVTCCPGLRSLKVHMLQHSAELLVPLQGIVGLHVS